MKRIAIICVIGTLLFFLYGCGQKLDSNVNKATTGTELIEQTEATEQSDAKIHYLSEENFFVQSSQL